MSQQFSCNGRAYTVTHTPTVIVCIDGLDPAYLDAAVAEGCAPFMQSMSRFAAYSAMPSFTNPNNVSLITGVTPQVHGIAGNYFFDPEAAEPVMMNSPEFLRADSILAKAAEAGMRVGAITAKDKLRRLIGSGLGSIDGSFTVSIETIESEESAFAKEVCTQLGAPPEIYSSEASLAVLQAGLQAINGSLVDLLYLTTTDYVQHTYAPEAPEALAFVEQVDQLLADINKTGAHLVVTADHGMQAKTNAARDPDVAYLADTPNSACPNNNARVILPITDPYVVHHGALGAFATVYLDQSDIPLAREALNAVPQVELVLTREEAVESLELPEDRIGDLVVLATRSGVVGTRAEDHDLAALHGDLRSHGGRHEQIVPFLVNWEIAEDTFPTPLRNFDAFHVALNLAPNFEVQDA